jgi:hypothetical protein
MRAPMNLESGTVLSCCWNFSPFPDGRTSMQSDKGETANMKQSKDLRSMAIVRMRPAEFFARVLAQQVFHRPIHARLHGGAAVGNADAINTTRLIICFDVLAAPFSLAHMIEAMLAVMHFYMHHPSSKLQCEEATGRRRKAAPYCFRARRYSYGSRMRSQ